MPLWAKIPDLIWKLFGKSEWWKVVVYLLFFLRKTTLSLEKWSKANKGQKGQWRPSKAKRKKNLWIHEFSTWIHVNTLIANLTLSIHNQNVAIYNIKLEIVKFKFKCNLATIMMYSHVFKLRIHEFEDFLCVLPLMAFIGLH